MTENVLKLELKPQELLAVALHADCGIGLAATAGLQSVTTSDPADLLATIDQANRPRWVWWDQTTAAALASQNITVTRCWDVLTVNRFLFGHWRTSIPHAWALLNNVDPSTIPVAGQLDLLSQAPDHGADPDNPVRPDGHLRPEWLDGGWYQSTDRLAAWAALAFEAANRQLALIEERPNPQRSLSTAHSESAAELLCAELAHYGLPIDQDEADRIIAEAAGPRPTTRAEELAEQARRDAEVLRHLNTSDHELPQAVNLRNPGEVKAMLNRTGLDLPDTRAWRLEKLRDTSPLIDALLVWRKAERIATTYGYFWLDEHVRDGRLRGGWSSCDGAAGRMTASAGLHNLPTPMRPAVAADPDHSFVRADLGQIEPRVLAAVSGDPALIAATAETDLYQPVAKRLGVERDVAKVAVLGAMYGATTGESAGALRGLQQNYPVAMALLERAAEDGKRGADIYTVGGRRVRTGSGASPDGDLDRAVAAAAARGRYARNALIQGAAAEFFKVWAVIVRGRVQEHQARIVLCLHDELLVHAPTDQAEAVAAVVNEAVAETAFYWSPTPDVRFLADVSIINRWSEAKG